MMLIRNYGNNPNELNFARKLSTSPLNYLHSGYPDYTLFTEEGMIFVEIKSSKDQNLGKRQYTMFKTLSKTAPLLICFDGNIKKMYIFEEKFGKKLNNYHKEGKKINFKVFLKKHLKIEFNLIPKELEIDNNNPKAYLQLYPTDEDEKE